MLNIGFTQHGSLCKERSPVAISNLSKERKLNQAEQFAAVFREGKKLRCASFTLNYKHNGLKGPRLGMVIAKKVVRLATGRNRVKRLVRESFRLHQQKMESLDIVLVAHPDINRLDNFALRQLLEKQWLKLSSAVV